MTWTQMTRSLSKETSLLPSNLNSCLFLWLRVRTRCLVLTVIFLCGCGLSPIRNRLQRYFSGLGSKKRWHARLLIAKRSISRYRMRKVSSLFITFILEVYFTLSLKLELKLHKLISWSTTPTSGFVQSAGMHAWSSLKHPCTKRILTLFLWFLKRRLIMVIFLLWIIWMLSVPLEE